MNKPIYPITTQWIVLLLPFLIFSCALGDYTTSQYTEIEPYECKVKDSTIYIFFEGEPVDFNYTKVGYVNAQGSKYATHAEVLNHLKYEAWKHCANGLIQTSSGFTYREREVEFFEEGDTDVYSSKYYSALAVRIDTDSAFLAKYGSGIDTTFVQPVTAYKAQQHTNKSSRVTLSIIGLTFGLILVAIAAASS